MIVTDVDIELYKNKFVVYRVYNINDGKSYIGKCEHGLNRVIDHIKRYSNIKTEYRARLLYRAIKKHGLENYRYSIEFVANTSEELNIKEREFISQLKTTNREFGYNITDGGTGGNTYRYLTKEEQSTASARLSEAIKKSWNNNSIRRIQSSECLKKTRSCPEKSKKNREMSSNRLKVLNKIVKPGCKPVMCLQNNIIYSSIRAAAEALNINADSLRARIRGKIKSSKTDSYTFKLMVKP